MPLAPRPSVVVIEADPLVVRAVRADLPHARAVRLPPLRRDAVPEVGAPPDLVILGASRLDTAAQRRLIEQAWGPAVVVVEVSDETPIARVWRTPTASVAVGLAPGFLMPFLARLTPAQARASAWLPPLRCVGYVAAAANLLNAVRLDRPELVALWVCVFLLLVLSLLRQTHRERGQGDGVFT